MQRAINDVIANAHTTNLEQAITTGETYFKIEEEFFVQENQGLCLEYGIQSGLRN